MLDLDEGERLKEDWLTSTDWVCAYMSWLTWGVNNASDLIAELRAARETIDALRGLLQAHGIEEGP